MVVLNCYCFFFIFPGDITKAQRPVSAGTLSSNEDPDEGDGNVTSYGQSEFCPEHYLLSSLYIFIIGSHRLCDIFIIKRTGMQIQQKGTQV